MVGRIRYIKVTGGIYYNAFGLRQLCRHGWAAIAHKIAARHGGELINGRGRRQGRNNYRAEPRQR
jgi:hypothetical protein